ncbi:type VII secretion protein EccE [Nocardia tenerifensis]|uniref:type VII secretion protein EccE n=1 Tax=Nocardia tenerifensis TaxID=228006 RepID=UPI00030CE7A7|nr:type VII secretion protein EccE [Nocardia tenerifensis]
MNNEQIPGTTETAAAAIPPPGPCRRTPFDLAPLTIVLPCAAAGTAAATTAIALDAPLWGTASAGVAACVLGAARVRKTNIWRILGMRTALWWRNRRENARPAHTEPFDVPIPETSGDRCGMRWDGSHLITMLALDRAAVTPTLLDTADIHSSSVVSLADVARCLDQFDIRLSAVDVLALGVRTQGPHNVADLYQKLLGPLPAAASRTLWLVLRFDPLDNAGAIGNRGGGQEGMIRAALVATRRVASRLTTRGVRVSVLTAVELAAAEAATLHDTEVTQWSENWRALRNNSIELTGYAIPPARLDSGVLTSVWALPGKSVLTRLRLTPKPESNTPGRRGTAVALTALVRRDVTGGPDTESDSAVATLGLLPLPGNQRRLLLDGGHLPLSAALSGPAAAMARFTVPVGGCGQVIGATESGSGVAVPLFGPSVRRVEIVGSLGLTQLMVLRSVAVGAKVIVHSARPSAWEHLVDEVGAPAALSVSSAGGSHHAASATMIVYDGVTSAGQVSDATAVYVRGPEEAAGPDADVVLIESADAPGQLVLRTAGEDLTVRLVSLPEEFEYLGATATEAEALAPTA